MKKKSENKIVGMEWNDWHETEQQINFNHDLKILETWMINLGY